MLTQDNYWLATLLAPLCNAVVTSMQHASIYVFAISQKAIRQATAIQRLIMHVAAAHAYHKRHPVHSWTQFFSCCLQAAETLGMVSVDVPGAGETDTQTVQSLVSKKTSTSTPAATVPVETILVPATPVATAPPVAVSGMGCSHLFYAMLLLKCKTAMHMLFVAALPLRFAQLFSVCKHRLQSMQMTSAPA